MSGLLVRRRPLRRFLLRALPLLVLLALTGTLAAALQVHDIRVSGARRFPAAQVEQALRAALGTPTVAARPEALREMVLTVPWVADARVRLSLDGTVTCAVTERVPVAVALDNGRRSLVDREGTVLAPAGPTDSGLEIEGFGAEPETRAAVLAALPELQRAWGAAARRVTRLGPSDVALRFADTDCVVAVDPDRPEQLAAARRVLSAWIAAHGAAPLRLDARAAGRVAVLPAPEPEADAEAE
ncbi:MAG: FtsQ-type POTRA domain-containing protein [Acidobacteriota bacterium]